MPVLPDRLDYREDLVVCCTVPGCAWTRSAVWSELAKDGDVDWEAEHPAHGQVPS